MSKLLKDRESIIAWLTEHRITNYTLIKNTRYGYVVDVSGDVSINEAGLTEIQVQFGTVKGFFYCKENLLTSLEGCPTSVGKSFDCSNNNIESLEYCPSEVGLNFICDRNKLRTLENCPTNIAQYFSCAENELVSLRGAPVSVGEDFICSDNKLISLEYCPTSVGANFDCTFNKLSTLEYIPDTVSGIFECYGNKKLGMYQKLVDFAELKAKIISEKEKALLSESIGTPEARAVLKV